LHRLFAVKKKPIVVPIIRKKSTYGACALLLQLQYQYDGCIIGTERSHERHILTTIKKTRNTEHPQHPQQQEHPQQHPVLGITTLVSLLSAPSTLSSSSLSSSSSRLVQQLHQPRQEMFNTQQPQPQPLQLQEQMIMIEEQQQQVNSKNRPHPPNATAAVATNEAMDAFAQHILEHTACTTATTTNTLLLPIEDSLGPYITNCLRTFVVSDDESPINTTATTTTDITITDIPDYESICELVHEHCHVESMELVLQVLQTILTMVQTQQVPPLLLLQPQPQPPPAPPEPIEETTATIAMRQVQEDKKGANSAQEPSNDLVKQQQQQQQRNNSNTEDMAVHRIKFNDMIQDMDNLHVTAAAATAAPPTDPCNDDGPTRTHRSNNRSSHCYGSTTSTTTAAAAAATPTAATIPFSQQQQEQEELESVTTTLKEQQLTAAVPQPQSCMGNNIANDKQSDCDDSNSLPFQQQQVQHQHVQDEKMRQYQQQSTTTLQHDVNVEQQQQQQQRQQQYVDIDDYIIPNMVRTLLQLYAMQDVSHTAATVAAQLSRGNISIAQYILTCALTQVPICRQLLLNDNGYNKCYRADCTYNHDMTHHTCAFWLKSRGCSKRTQTTTTTTATTTSTTSSPDTCRFLHGFSSKILDMIPDHMIQPPPPPPKQQSQQPQVYTQMQITPYRNVRDFHASTPMSRDTVPTTHPNTGQSTKNIISHNPTSITNGVWGTTGTTGNKSSFANIASRGYNNQQSFVPLVGNNNNDQDKSKTTHQRSTTNTHPQQQQVKSTIIQQQQQQQPIANKLIPQTLWQAHENRDASAFYIVDPLERYYTVSSQQQQQPKQRSGGGGSRTTPNDTTLHTIDLHYQSVKSFPIVLDTILPQKLASLSPSTSSKNDPQNGIWIITGTGHHVNTQRTHQKGGGALESAVLEYLVYHYCYSDTTLEDVTGERNGTGVSKQPQQYRIYRGRDKNGKGGAIYLEQRF
jgi:hypothetical protein